jgi:hypothetical protein
LQIKKSNQKKGSKMVVLEDFHELLQRDVSRQEFLRYIGIAILGLVGIASMLENLHKAFGKSQPKQISQQGKSSGYGLSAYGQ